MIENERRRTTMGEPGPEPLADVNADPTRRVVVETGCLIYVRVGGI
jgi:hypothetical protein